MNNPFETDEKAEFLPTNLGVTVSEFSEKSVVVSTTAEILADIQAMMSVATAQGVEDAVCVMSSEQAEYLLASQHPPLPIVQMTPRNRAERRAAWAKSRRSRS